MFSATPRMGTLTFSNIAAPRRATATAAVCGVVTITAPLRAIDWAIDNWASPVPGEVDEQDVQFAPADVGRELRDGLHDHRAAPDDRGVLVDQQTHGHDLDPKVLQRKEDVPVDLGPAGYPNHQRDRGAVDIAIHQADPVGAALLGQRAGQGAGQIDGESGLADAALAAGDGDDVFHLTHAGISGRLPGDRGGARRQGAFRYGDGDGNFGRLGAERLEYRLDVGVELLGNRGVGGGHG